MLAPALMWHPVHVSVAHVEYDASMRRFRISVRVFKDDFETLIEAKYGIRLGLTEGKELAGNVHLVREYFEENLGIVVNSGKKLRFDPAGIRENEESVWFMYKSQEFRRVQKLVVTNSILLELFEDQTNLFIISYGDLEKGYRFSFTDREAVIPLI